jgi:hypothetical protein
VLLSELRAILEPLLTTGPLEVLPAGWREAPAKPPGLLPPSAVPRTAVRPVAMDGEETW